MTAPAPAAVCHRCGGEKRGPFVPCKHCGVTPAGVERQIAWLFSEHHLDAAELQEAARRLVAGERPDPSRALLEVARRRMGIGPSEGPAQRPLPTWHRLALLLANLAFSPLVGLVAAWGLAESRPVAARQCLRETAPLALIELLLWGGLILRWRLDWGG